MNTRRRKIYWIVAAVAILLVFIVRINPSPQASFLNLFHFRTISEGRSYVDSLGAWGPVIMVGLTIVGLTLLIANIVKARLSQKFKL